MVPVGSYPLLRMLPLCKCLGDSPLEPSFRVCAALIFKFIDDKYPSAEGGSDSRNLPNVLWH